MIGTLLRFIWKLYPRRWRERFGAEAEADLGRVGPRPRLLLDALRTLPRAWWAETARWLTGSRGGRGGGGSGLGTDLRGAWRSLVRSPGHAALVIATLSLAIGANAAVFSVSWAVLLRTLPYDEPERIVSVTPAPVQLGGPVGWRAQERFTTLPDVEAVGLYIPDGGANLVDEDGAVRLDVTQVDPGFFTVLGVEAVTGRTIGPEPSGDPEVVLSHGLWVDAFGADPGVVGRSLDLSGHRFTVVGVAPPDVDLPAGTDLWASMPAVPDFYASAFGPSVIARLPSSASIPAVVAARRAHEAEDFADSPPRFSPREVVVASLREELIGPIRAPLLALSGAAAAVLLLGCLNLAGIQVARVFRRSGELGVRRALGAGSGRILRHLAMEVALLAAASGAAALLVAWTAGRLLASWLPPELPGLEHAGLTPPVLAFTVLVTVLAALAVGLFPALRGARAGRLTLGGRTATADRERVRLQEGLVVAQVVVAIVLSVGAGLLGRSLAELRAVPLGYDTSSVLTFRVRLPSDAYPDVEMQHRYVERVRERVRALPGVDAVGVSNRLPLESGMGRGVGIRAGAVEEGGEAISASWIEASEEFFDAMGVRLLAGTTPTPAAVQGEDMGGVVIDRTTASRLYGTETPLGQPIVFQGRREFPGVVVGVVEDVRLQGHAGPSQHVVYTSAEGAWLTAASFTVRTAGRPSRLAGPVRAAVAEVDPTVPAFEIRSTGDAVAEELAATRTLASLAGLFGVAGLVLVGLGLYGMVSQNVATRRRELGIRLALGAAVGRVVGGTVSRALLLVLGGVALGVPLSFLVTRALQGLLFGVAPGDPSVLLAVAGVVLVVGALAALIPASRVGRIDPVESLRAE